MQHRKRVVTGEKTKLMQSLVTSLKASDMAINKVSPTEEDGREAHFGLFVAHSLSAIEDETEKKIKCVAFVILSHLKSIK